MVKLFFLLSGEHEDLPFSELKAILEAEGYDYVVLEKLDQIVRLEADISCIDALKRRAALTRVCCLELFSCKTEIDSIVKAARSMSFDEVLGEQKSFAVRMRRVRRHAPKLDLMMLERKLGELVLDGAENARVNLKKPDKTFVGVVTAKFVFGLRLAEIAAKPFVERRPRRRPFFHPSAMQAKLARCMVNLAKPRTGELVVDPFCGTGSMLAEAGLIGCRVLGFDIQRRMAKGTLRNLRHVGVDAEGVALGDADRPPYIRADCVVTDPPYGISSTTRKRTTRRLVEQLLRAVHGVLREGQRVCLASPKTLRIREIGEDLGYRHIESHFVYVHRSLTREIVVFEKV